MLVELQTPMLPNSVSLTLKHHFGVLVLGQDLEHLGISLPHTSSELCAFAVPMSSMPCLELLSLVGAQVNSFSEHSGEWPLFSPLLPILIFSAF